MFHRIIPGFMIQGGDFTYGNGLGGESIYGGKFEDEFSNGVISHDRPFLLSMANCGKNTNNSQFFITLSPCEWLDEKHVVFGQVTRGISILQAAEKLGSRSGCPRAIVRISNCGEVEDNVQRIIKTPPPKIPSPGAYRFNSFYSPRGSPRKKIVHEDPLPQQQQQQYRQKQEEEKTLKFENGGNGKSIRIGNGTTSSSARRKDD